MFKERKNILYLKEWKSQDCMKDFLRRLASSSDDRCAGG